jgi:hypothetical protein
MLANGHRRTLIALVFAFAMPVMALAGPLACSGDKIQADGECVDTGRAAGAIDEIVRKLMADQALRRRQSGPHQGVGGR